MPSDCGNTQRCLKNVQPTLPSSCLQSFVCVNKVSGIILQTPFDNGQHISLLFASPLSPFPRSAFTLVRRRKNYPSCPLISTQRAFSQGGNTVILFSLRCSPFYQCQMITQGETELGNNMHQVSQGPKPPLPASSVPLLYCPPFVSTYALHPCAS